MTDDQKNNRKHDDHQDESPGQKKSANSPDDLYSFQLNIVNATGIGELAGELWTIAKSLREGTIKQAYGNTKTPCRVEWEIRHEARAEVTTLKAVAKVNPDGTKVAEAEVIDKKVAKKKKEKEKEEAPYTGPTSEVSQIKGSKSTPNQSG